MLDEYFHSIIKQSKTYHANDDLSCNLNTQKLKSPNEQEHLTQGIKKNIRPCIDKYVCLPLKRGRVGFSFLQH